MRSRPPARPSSDPEAFADRIYDDHVEALFRALGRVRGKKAAALAALLYRAYASVHFGERSIEKHHAAIDPWEADVCKALADQLMVRSNRDPLSRDEIAEFFHG